MKTELTRRQVLAAGSLALAGAAFGAAGGESTKKSGDNSIVDAVAFKAYPPCLQAPGETTMGVSWGVTGLAKGVVEYADNPEMRDFKTALGGSDGIVPIDSCALQVRITGLKPSTRYWYRTVTTPFANYRDSYNARLGKSVVSAVHSFTTMGTGARGHFCMISDTHANWRAFDMEIAKIKQLSPSAVIWNGDATNTTQDKETATKIFLAPPVANADWSSDMPVFFECGNHDFRGSWIPRKEEVMLPRCPAERSSAYWNLKWNFATRLGELALIGLDTGEDKPDAHPKWFGLANFEPYRREQAVWLKEQLARPEIASAPLKVVFCHIPLYAAPDSSDYPHDGVAIDPHDYAFWSRECSDLWGQMLNDAGVNLVVCGHKHRFRYDPPGNGRKWAQVVGGGPELGNPDPGRFPTVVEGMVENGRLHLVVHDVEKSRIVFDSLV